MRTMKLTEKKSAEKVEKMSIKIGVFDLIN